MIRVRKLIGRPDSGENRHLDISGISGVTIAARNLERSIDFYSRVFGLRARRGRATPRRTATLAVPGEAIIAIHEHGESANRALPPHGRWGFLVDELDSVREAVWDLGIKVADDNGEPDHIHRWSNGRSLRVRDPDGNEIELIEECRGSAAALIRRSCPVRRWVQRTPCPAP